MSILRRSFLKLGTALVGSAVIAQYAEPMVLIPAKPKLRDWIEDRGDHYIVRVPDGREFGNEKLDKPTIFLLGQQARVRGIVVLGFVNMMAPRGGSFFGCCFDGSKMTTEHDRAIVEASHSEGLLIDSCEFRSNGSFDGIHFKLPTGSLQQIATP